MKRKPKGFTLLEVMIVTASLGVLASIAFVSLGNIRESAREQKLVSDAKTLNRAVSAYLASGGSLAEAKTVEDVLNRLRSAASADVGYRLPGFSSSLVDSRVSYRLQSDSEATSGDLRVTWDGVSNQFIVVSAGGVGVKEFILDETLAEGEVETESLEAALLYAKDSGWIWDYQDKANPGPSPGSTAISVGLVPPSSAPPAMPSPPPPAAKLSVSVPSSGALAAPLFSTPGGTYPIGSFSLPLTLTDPNPGGAAKILYAVDYGSWSEYTSPLTVDPGAVVSAQAISQLSGWSDSARIDQTYVADPAQLLPPSINPDYNSFGFFYDYDITVVLGNTNPAGTSNVEYRVNGGAWQAYGAPLLLEKGNFPAGALVEARVVPVDPTYYLSSATAARSLSAESLSLTGMTAAEFYNPVGPSTMETSLGPAGRDSEFQWGKKGGKGNKESSMKYSGSNFVSVADGVRFEIGNLDYYNGMIAADTGATSVSLDIQLSLNINGNLFNPFFDFEFDLINTPNTADAWANADYVKLQDAISSRTLVINDYEYEFLLEFGETSAEGFSYLDEFHVLEEMTAQGKLYGTFRSLGPIGGASTDPTKGGLAVAGESGTGTVGDPIYQKTGYVDPLEFVSDLEEFTKALKDEAKSGRDLAEDGASLALKGEKDIASKIAEQKYLEAYQLARDSAAGVIAAEDAALLAEAKANEAKTAADRAYEMAVEDQANFSSLEKWSKDSDLKKKSDKVTVLALETQTLANEARAAADAAAADAAVVAAIWADFEANAAVSDPEGVADYLADAARAEMDIAKDAENDAKKASSEAIKKRDETADKISDGKHADAEKKAQESAAKAAEADALAVMAANAAVAANDAATKVNSIAASNPAAASAAADALDFAADTVAYATDARMLADAALAAAADAAAMIAALP